MPEWINNVFDVVMLLAVFGMWLLWWRTSRKQRLIESMLLEAAQELEVATSRLGDALEYIRRLKEESDRPVVAARRRPEKVSPPREKAAAAPQQSRQNPPSGDIAKMLRMRREGKDVDAIAESLNLPKAQVRLLLKLHTAGE